MSSKSRRTEKIMSLGPDSSPGAIIRPRNNGAASSMRSTSNPSGQRSTSAIAVASLELVEVWLPAVITISERCATLSVARSGDDVGPQWCTSRYGYSCECVVTTQFDPVVEGYEQLIKSQAPRKASLKAQESREVSKYVEPPDVVQLRSSWKPQNRQDKVQIERSPPRQHGARTQGSIALSAIL